MSDYEFSIGRGHDGVVAHCSVVDYFALSFMLCWDAIGRLLQVVGCGRRSCFHVVIFVSFLARRGAI